MKGTKIDLFSLSCCFIEREIVVSYEDLFSDTSIEVGKTLSKHERDRKHLQSQKSLIYGEVIFDSFYDILRTIAPKSGSVFYDLGSGTGKAVLIARLAFDFSKCIGIEILESLHEQALTIAAEYRREYQHLLYESTVSSNGETLTQNSVNFVCDSLTNFNWTDGDVVFVNSTCFEDDLIKELSQIAEKLNPGAIVVTFTKGLISNKFELLERKRYKMSWGPATVFIQRRVSDDNTKLPPYRLNKFPSDSEYNGDNESATSVSSSYATSDANSMAVRFGSTLADEDDDDEEEDDIGDGTSDNYSYDFEEMVRNLPDGSDDEDEDNEGIHSTRDKNVTPTKKNASPYQLQSPSRKLFNIFYYSFAYLFIGESSDSNFELLTSPQDTALLKRKRMIPRMRSMDEDD